MTASADSIFALVVLVGAFMISMWLMRRHAQHEGLRGKQAAGRWGVLALWVASLVIIPVVARAGSQTGWTFVITSVTAVTLGTGMRDLREFKDK